MLYEIKIPPSPFAKKYWLLSIFNLDEIKKFYKEELALNRREPLCIAYEKKPILVKDFILVKIEINNRIRM